MENMHDYRDVAMHVYTVQVLGVTMIMYMDCICTCMYVYCLLHVLNIHGWNVEWWLLGGSGSTNWVGEFPPVLGFNWRFPGTCIYSAWNWV